MWILSDAPVPARLLNGARVLGKLWNEKTRCPNGWAYCDDSADHERTTFCKAKYQWLKLAMGVRDAVAKSSREERVSDKFIVSCMTDAELDASCITMKIEIPEVGLVALPRHDGQMSVELDGPTVGKRSRRHTIQGCVGPGPGLSHGYDSAYVHGREVCHDLESHSTLYPHRPTDCVE